jgi:hypothetical protein
LERFTTPSVLGGDPLWKLAVRRAAALKTTRVRELADDHRSP